MLGGIDKVSGDGDGGEPGIYHDHFTPKQPTHSHLIVNKD